MFIKKKPQNVVPKMRTKNGINFDEECFGKIETDEASIIPWYVASRYSESVGRPMVSERMYDKIDTKIESKIFENKFYKDREGLAAFKQDVLAGKYYTNILKSYVNELWRSFEN